MTTLILRLNEIHDLITHSAFSPDIVPIDLDEKLARQQEIAIVWSIEDVQEMRPDLTDEQAWEVLQIVKRRHDATQGVNWDTLTYCADDLFPESSSLASGE